MPDSRPQPSRALLVVDRPEASYRYANADRAETEIVLAGPDGSFVAEGHYDEVVVIGFADRPAVLRSVIDRASALGTGGSVLVGASNVAVHDDAAAWATAFDGLSVTGMGAVPAPAVVVTQAPGDATAGAYVRGALAAISMTTPRPVDVLPPVEASTEPPAPHPLPTVPPAPSGGGLVGRARRLVAARRRLVLTGMSAVIVALLVAVGLVALIDEFFLAIVATLILVIVTATWLRVEQRGQRVERTLSSIETMDRASRGDLRGLVSTNHAGPLLTLAQEQAEEIVALRRSMAVNELATVEAARILDELRNRQEPTA